MESNKNMYVRNKYGIAKIIDIKKEENYDVLVFDKNICYLVNETTGEILENELYSVLPLTDKIDINKINASYNIIDLIEVGDYVNGYCVKEKQDKFLIIDSKDNWCWGEGVMPIEEIKSIVTREQYESMKYNIGE